VVIYGSVLIPLKTPSNASFPLVRNRRFLTRQRTLSPSRGVLLSLRPHINYPGHKPHYQASYNGLSQREISLAVRAQLSINDLRMRPLGSNNSDLDREEGRATLSEALALARRICMICDTPSNSTCVELKIIFEELAHSSLVFSFRLFLYPVLHPASDSQYFINARFHEFDTKTTTHLFYTQSSRWWPCMRISMLAMEWKGEITSQPCLSGWQLSA
jgi:hypothetical protein